MTANMKLVGHGPAVASAHALFAYAIGQFLLSAAIYISVSVKICIKINNNCNDMHWKRIGIVLHVMQLKETFHCEEISLI